MVVRELSTKGFRNLTAGDFQPGQGVNILHGDNAQGKTNLLEAIWLFTGGRSFRGARDGELPSFGGEGAHLSMRFHAGDREQEAALRIERRRTATLNGLDLPAASKLAGIFCAVVFSPAHLSLIKDGPEERRRFIDTAYCQLRPGYIATLSEYQRALAQRNALLKAIRKEGADPELLDIWDRRLAQSGCRVAAARTAYCQKIAAPAGEIYAGLSGGRETLCLRYETSGEKEGGAEALEALFRQRRQTDIAAGFTTAGPHRDDLHVEIGGLSARIYGSQGQQRSAVLALKMAEASLLREITGEQPVALRDDVMSELDVSRQDYILNHIEGWQVFITCCEPAAVLRLTGGSLFRLEQGRIIPEAG